MGLKEQRDVIKAEIASVRPGRAHASFVLAQQVMAISSMHKWYVTPEAARLLPSSLR